MATGAGRAIQVSLVSGSVLSARARPWSARPASVLLGPVLLAVAACASGPSRSPSGSDTATSPSTPTATAPRPPGSPGPTKGKGGYYMDDGPLDTSGINLDAIPDAVPNIEPMHRFANRPYNVFGVDYSPQQSLDNPFSQSGMGSWYGRKFHGQRTSSGEIYDMFAMTAAHPTLPIPSFARVTNPRNNKSVIVRVNDRGPFLHNRVIDLSYAAAYRLGYVTQGSAEVRVEKLTPTVIAALRMGRPDSPVTPPEPAVAAAVPTSPSITPTASADASSVLPGSFFLQLGAFSVEDNARVLLSRLALEFSDELPNLQVVRKEPLFRLLAGPYRSRDEAVSASRRLKQSAAIASVVVAP